MAEQESHHKRSKSTLSLLRRNLGKVDDDVSSDNGSIASNTVSQPALPPGISGKSVAPSQSSTHSRSPTMAGITKTISETGKNTKLPAASGQDKALTIEQSVRKFRVFEALRSGDTAQISKSIREAAEGDSAVSHLEDTTILHLAIQCAELPVVEYVLSDGASVIDVNARDKDGNTPLHVAALQGRGQVVRLLLEQNGINDSIANAHGKLPLDLARTPDIFQQLQLSRSLFVDTKIKEIQLLIAGGNYTALGDLLEEPRANTVLDINGGEFASEITTVQSGGTLLHEAARRKNTQLIQVLLLHGADPFRRDRRGKLPQDVTKDETTRAMLKKSPAAVAAQRGIQEKAVLGNLSQNAGASGVSDALAGKESREMKGYLKKWTNYRKGYQLRWFVLEDGVLSYYKHQDDTGSACRGAINMRIAKLNMDPTEKQKFEIIGKSSVKYSLKANHEVEAKRWFWALNNSIQWTKDQAKEEYRQKERVSELLRQAKAEQSDRTSTDYSATSLAPESISGNEIRRGSTQSAQASPANEPARQPSQRVSFKGTSTAGSVRGEDEGTTYGSYEASLVNDATRIGSNVVTAQFDGEYEEDYGDDSSSREPTPISKDAFNITAQSAKLQLDMMNQVHMALQSEQNQNPGATISDTLVRQALSTYDDSIQTLSGLLGDIVKISKDRDDYWQRRLDHEAELRQMWEDSMAQVAREHEALEARVGESEEKRKRTKRALREVIQSSSRPESRGSVQENGSTDAVEATTTPEVEIPPMRRTSTSRSITQRKSSIMADINNLSDSESEDDEEFFDAIDAGEIAIGTISPRSPQVEDISEKMTQQLTLTGDDLSASFKGYGEIRKRLKMDADDRPKISLWGILKSMIGKDMTKMTLPVSFNEPTSLLQRCAEDMEYADLLDIAAERTESTERMVYVAAFAASEYASTIGRVAKPFNPLLGETFEYARPDKQYRFFIEQVSHHPPIGAAWAESPRWTYYGESAVKSKFYGKSFDINPLGTWFLKLRPTNGDKEEFYTWKKVTSSVVGIITGSPTVDNYGIMEIKNWTTGEVSTVDFKPRGWTASSAYHISGRVLDARGKPRFSLGGRWNSKIYARLTPGYEAPIEEPKGPLHHRDSIIDANQAFLVWQANPRPTGIPFNLTPFVVTLNDINDELRPYLAPTDTRLRPDQRAMEDGEYDFAATEKNRVEEKQRATRKRRELSGEEFVPRWFKKSKCEITGEEFWVFNGQYWEEREKAARGESNWEGVERIF